MNANRTPTIIWIRRLIWLYFILLIIEGALRKWVVPSLSNVLLLVRDPVVIAIYILAARARVFPHNLWMTACGFLAVLCLFAGLYAMGGALPTALYGIHADFLHLPLIFVIPRVFDIREVQKIGYWSVAIAIPMGILMAIQFKAPSGSWLNAGASGGRQITGGLGHIRPAGTFSFINGAEGFYALAVAFILSSYMAKTRYPAWLVPAAAFASLIAVSVSSSRGMAGFILTDIACAIIIATVLKPGLISRVAILRLVQVAMAGGTIIVLAMQLPVFSEGLAAFNKRMDPRHGSASALLGRVAENYTQPADLIMDTPLLGQGLGLGTNGGVALSNGDEVGHILAEDEWPRVILESGPILGGAYLLLRTLLVLWIMIVTTRSAKRGNPLPFMLFGSCAIMLLNGQFGQPSELGFAVFSAGLALAARNTVDEETPQEAALPA